MGRRNRRKIKTMWRKALQHYRWDSNALVVLWRIMYFSKDNFVGRKMEINAHKGARTQEHRDQSDRDLQLGY